MKYSVVSGLPILLFIIQLKLITGKNEERKSIADESNPEETAKSIPDNASGASFLRVLVVQTPTEEQSGLRVTESYPTIWRSSLEGKSVWGSPNTVPLSDGLSHLHRFQTPYLEDGSVVGFGGPSTARPDFHLAGVFVTSHPETVWQSGIGNLVPNQELYITGNQNGFQNPVSSSQRSGINLANLLSTPATIDSKTSNNAHIGNTSSSWSDGSQSYSEYYDDMYDEFVDKYFDAEASRNDTKSKGKNVATSAEEPKSSHSTSSPTDAKDILKPGIPTLSSKDDASISIPSKNVTLDNGETTVGLKNRTISLSEVLQEMSMTLPQFLGTLKTHRLSLKGFTEKLSAKSLSRLDFEKARGDPVVLFKMVGLIDSPLDQEIPGLQTVSKPKESDRLTKESTVLTSTARPTDNVDVPVMTFGFRPETVSLPRPKPTSNSENEDKNLALKEQNSDPVAIQLEVITLRDSKEERASDLESNSEPTLDKSNPGSYNESTTTKPRLTTVPLRPYRKEPERLRPHRPRGYDHNLWNEGRDLVNNRLSSTPRPTIRPPYEPRSPRPSTNEDLGSEPSFGSTEIVDKSQTGGGNMAFPKDNLSKKTTHLKVSHEKTKTEDSGLATRSAIMAAGILGGVALIFFIAIFVVVKYRSHLHRNKRRPVLALPSESSSSSFPPLYATRNGLSKEDYKTSGFWNTLKKRFDPYSPSTTPSSYKDTYIYG